MFTDIPAKLRSADLIRVRFHLEFEDACDLGLDSILRLRRDLHKVGRQILGEGERFLRLFDPPLPVDPVALRRHQRPGPPFALHPPAALPGSFGPGDLLVLPAVFLGAGIDRLADFARVLDALGRQGLHPGEGRFELAAIEAEDAAGGLRPLWRQGERFEQVAPPLLEASWWLESVLPSPSPVVLELRTPARLLAGGRPLFRAAFPQLFPFLLRRVSSMLNAHCRIEAVDDPRALLAAATRVVEGENRLVWKDWRVLEGPEHRLDFGGLVGTLRLEGEELAPLLWVLRLASLLNVGRGAAYGAGHLAVRPPLP